MNLSLILIMSCVIVFKNLWILKTTPHPLVLVLVEQVDIHVFISNVNHRGSQVGSTVHSKLKLPKTV